MYTFFLSALSFALFFSWLLYLLLTLSAFRTLRRYWGIPEVSVRTLKFTGKSVVVTDVKVNLGLIQDVKPHAYIEEPYSYSLSTSQFEVRLHLPRPSDPYWAVVLASGNEYSDSLCHASLAAAQVKLWLFPVLFRFTLGPWASVNLDDFRVKVFTSRRTPRWIEKLRNTLVETALDGEYLNCVEFKTNAKLNVSGSSVQSARNEYYDAQAREGSSSDEDSSDSEGRYGPTPYIQMPVAGQDDIQFGFKANGWDIFNPGDIRAYSFGKIDAQLTRSWREDHGSFTMVVEESRWTKLPQLNEQDAYVQGPFWRRLWRSIYTFPIGLCNVWRVPMSAVNLYVSRTDVRFDNFRIEDADLLPRLTHTGKRVNRDYRLSELLQEQMRYSFLKRVGQMDAVYEATAKEDD